MPHGIQYRAIAFIVLWVLSLGVGGIRQLTAAPPVDGRAQVPPELRRLEPLVAIWHGTNQVSATPTSPARQHPFTAQFHWLLDGLHLEGTLRFDRKTRPTQARITVSFDYDTREFVVHWIDDAWSQATLFRGKATSEDTLQLTADRSADGTTVHETLTLKISKDGWSLENHSSLHEPGSAHSTFTAVRNPVPAPR